MKCPFCGHPDTQVVDSRGADEGDFIRRRRRCTSCDRRFTTYERAELTMPAIVKRNGSRNDYEAVKLRASLSLALRKRPVSTFIEFDEFFDDTVQPRSRDKIFKIFGELINIGFLEEYEHVDGNVSVDGDIS
jgi:transcriptional regulator NrdR